MVQIEPGESLVLDLDVSDPVDVIYNSTSAANRSSGQICTVDGHSLQCTPEYTKRVAAALELRGMKPSESGIYSIKDKRNDEIILAYMLIVKGTNRFFVVTACISDVC